LVDALRQWARGEAHVIFSPLRPETGQRHTHASLSLCFASSNPASVKPCARRRRDPAAAAGRHPKPHTGGHSLRLYLPACTVAQHDDRMRPTRVCLARPSLRHFVLDFRGRQQGTDGPHGPGQVFVCSNGGLDLCWSSLVGRRCLRPASQLPPTSLQKTKRNKLPWYGQKGARSKLPPTRHDTTPSVSRRWKDSRQAAVGAPVGQVAAATERLSGASRVLVVVDLQHRGSLNRNRRNDLPFNPHPPRKSRELGPCCQAIKKKDSSLLKVQQCLDVCWHLVEEGACLRQG
jgi:hypothetical protein